jgi:hypothetical protein
MAPRDAIDRSGVCAKHWINLQPPPQFTLTADRDFGDNPGMESLREQSAASTAPARPKGRFGVVRDRKAMGRARASNGHDILPGVRDGRSLIARRYRDIVRAIVADQGGAAQISEARLQLVRRFSAAAVLAEQMESRLANGEQIDIAEHALLASTLVRIARRIGVNRVPRDVTPSPSVVEYLREAADA